MDIKSLYLKWDFLRNINNYKRNSLIVWMIFTFSVHFRSDFFITIYCFRIDPCKNHQIKIHYNFQTWNVLGIQFIKIFLPRYVCPFLCKKCVCTWCTELFVWCKNCIYFPFCVLYSCNHEVELIAANRFLLERSALYSRC